MSHRRVREPLEIQSPEENVNSNCCQQNPWREGESDDRKASELAASLVLLDLFLLFRWHSFHVEIRSRSCAPSTANLCIVPEDVSVDVAGSCCHLDNTSMESRTKGTRHREIARLFAKRKPDSGVSFNVDKDRDPKGKNKTNILRKNFTVSSYETTKLMQLVQR